MPTFWSAFHEFLWWWHESCWLGWSMRCSEGLTSVKLASSIEYQSSVSECSQKQVVFFNVGFFMCFCIFFCGDKIALLFICVVPSLTVAWLFRDLVHCRRIFVKLQTSDSVQEPNHKCFTWSNNYHGADTLLCLFPPWMLSEGCDIASLWFA